MGPISETEEFGIPGRAMTEAAELDATRKWNRIRRKDGVLKPTIMRQAKQALFLRVYHDNTNVRSSAQPKWFQQLQRKGIFVRANCSLYESIPYTRRPSV